MSDHLICKHCQGTGSIAIELGCSTRYRCTGCDGTGRVFMPEDEADERPRFYL